MLHLIGQVIFGLVVGAIAKWIMPGKDAGGILLTMLLGLAGSLIGTFVGRLLWGGLDYSAGWITSILGAVLVLWVYRMVKAKSGA